MPFTFSHAAAAIPFRRSRLIISALVIGTFAPDFEYFFMLGTYGKFGHTLRGALLADLPLALVVFWLFHLVIEQPMVSLLPDALRLRLRPRRFRFLSARTHVVVCLSVLVGIATHLLWDSLTHQDSWPYRHLALLRLTFYVPVLHRIHLIKLLQFASTVIGAAIVVVWIAIWIRQTPLHPAEPRSTLPPATRAMILAALVGFAVTITVGRAAHHSMIPVGRHDRIVFAGRAMVSSVSVLWALLVVYGLMMRDRRMD